MFPVMLNVTSTVRNFPKPPPGFNMASKSPPTEKVLYPSIHEVAFEMAAPAAALNY